jgi:serine/threonine-protein kinase
MDSKVSNASELDSRLGEVLAALLKAQERGDTPDPADWQARYPEFEAELREFFFSDDRLRSVTGPLRAVLKPEEPSIGVKLSLEDALPDVGPGQTFGAYELLEEIGKGGMGVVYKARQKAPDRLVALKIIATGRGATAQEIERFRNEADMAGQLDHPNVVPVYQVGEQGGLVFFSMKLIEGGTLADHLRGARFQRAQFPEGTLKTCPTPTDPRTAARLMAQVARAVHHAHQRGVLHRDLKPSNVLLDADGLPHVSDFGLAKHVEADGNLTQSGAFVGTPLYMAPEQTTGKRGAVTVATDVHGLGAVLYALLTGQPPWGGETVLDTLEQVKTLEALPPSRSNPRMDRDLDTICLKCLEKEPSRRYSSAAALADDLEAWLKGEPIAARPINRLARLWRRCRRHKALIVAAGLPLLTLLFVIGAVRWSQERQNAETIQAVADSLRDATRWQDKEDWAEALRVLDLAKGRLMGSGLTTLLDQVEQRRREAALVAGLEEAQLRSSDRYAADGAAHDLKAADRAYQEIFRSNDLDVTAISPAESARLIEDSAMRTRLVTALDYWAYVKDRLPGDKGEGPRSIARLVDKDLWRQQLRDSITTEDREAVKRLAEAEDVLSQPPASLLLLSFHLPLGSGREARARLLRQAQAQYPADFWLNVELGWHLADAVAKPAEAVGYFQAALARRPQSPVVYNSLGLAWAAQQKWPEAAQAFHKAVQFQPDFYWAYKNLGDALKEQGKLADAEDAFYKAIRLKPDYAVALNALGVTLREQQKFREAIDVFEKAAQYGSNSAHKELGRTFRAMRKPTEAEDASRKAIARDLNDPEAYDGLGNALADQGRLPQALEAYTKGLEVNSRHADSHNNLGVALFKMGKLPDAVAAFEKAIYVNPNYVAAYSNLGNVLVEQGRLPEAIRFQRKALQLNHAFAPAYNGLGNALRVQHQLPDAVLAFRRAIELDPKFALAYHNLARALRQLDRPGDASAALKKALELDPDLASASESLDQRFVPTAGALDPSFGAGTGRVIGPSGQVPAIVMQPDGKIVVGGAKTPPGGIHRFALNRYNAEGTLDTTFGESGTVQTAVGDSHSGISVRGLALQSDGKIIAVSHGASFRNRPVFAVVRYNPNGSLDSSFGAGGIVLTDVAAKKDGGSQFARAVALQSDGKIVVCGSSVQDTGPFKPLVFTVVRYNSDGTLDSSFGPNKNGIVLTPQFGQRVYANALAIQPDGKIVVEGTRGDLPPPLTGPTAMVVARYTAAGELDDSFGSGGIIKDLAPPGTSPQATDVLIQNNGQIIVAGAFSTQALSYTEAKFNSIGTLTLARLTSAGQLDTAFGNAGYVVSDSSILWVWATAREVNGRLVVAGYARLPRDSPRSAFAVAAYMADGALDKTFGVGGIASTDFLGARTSAWAMAIQPDGKIVVVGTTTQFGSDTQITALARFLPPGTSREKAALTNDDAANRRENTTRQKSLPSP